MDKKKFTAQDVAIEVLKKAKILVGDKLAKAEPKAPSTAQMQEIKIPKSPKSMLKNESPIAKQPLKLKEFLDRRAIKKFKKDVS